LLQKLMQDPSMMKLLTHPKTMEAMEEIAGQQQADPQQTEGNYFIFKCSIYSNLNLKRRTHLPVAVVPLGPCRDFLIDRINDSVDHPPSESFNSIAIQNVFSFNSIKK
jgi:hypothetical protein